ncbi:MAG: ABC transporter permease subunit [Acidobacteriota bacterium]|nr:ABC transporter permease subunit [Acidobacteriota bacterium]
MSAQLALLPAYLTAHLQLTLLAIGLSVLISVPAGILATRWPWIEQPVLAAAGIIQTIPGLALLALMVPVLAALRLESIGFLPAIIGLTLYGILPVLRNTVIGLAGVDPAVKEAARGVGMTPGQQLRRVELPLAMPVIVGGIRTATVWTVGMATLSTPVGATSLGNYIFSGLQTRNTAAVLLGCVASAALALVLDGIVHGIETAVAGRRRGRLAVALGLVVVLAGWAGGRAASGLLASGRQTITIGAKNFTEQYILSDLLAQQIHRRTGSPTRVLSSLGSTVVFDALRHGQIDAYVDYSGTIWANILHHTTVPADRHAVLEQVRQQLEARYGITLVCTLGFENAYALAMREPQAARLGVRTISQLAPHAPALTIGSDYEFFSRPEWQALRQVYGLRFRSQRSMDPALMYQAIGQGTVDVISAYSTDGRIAALNLRVLDDDRGAIPPYDAIVLASQRLVRERPDVIKALQALGGTIDAAAMRQMNLEVDRDRQDPAKVAEGFLEER